MNVALLEVAQQELDEAVSYYNKQSPGLGDSFVLETVSAIDRIRRFPEAWHPMGDENGVVILAVAHLHREPGYWRDRVR